MMKQDSEQNSVGNKEIEETDTNPVPEFYKSVTNNKSTGRLAGGLDVKVNIPYITETIDTVVGSEDFKIRFTGNYKKIPLVQGIGGNQGSIFLITPNNTNVITTPAYVELRGYVGYRVLLTVYNLDLGS